MKISNGIFLMVTKVQNESCIPGVPLRGVHGGPSRRAPPHGRLNYVLYSVEPGTWCSRTTFQKV